MDLDENLSKRARGRGRGSRARGRGRGRARGRGRKNTHLDDEASSELPEEMSPKEQITCVNNVDNLDDSGNNKENEPEEISVPTIDMEADISQLEAPTFTTISRGPPEPMLRLKWDHKVSLIGEKVLNPMIHCCDQCEKPILVYGRMIPCKHVFCLKCAKVEPIKVCPRCKDKVTRVEQTGLGTVFMCTHGGSRYGNTGCRRTYLSQRDLQAHINHRHVTQPTVNPDVTPMKSTLILDMKSLNVAPRKQIEQPITMSSPRSQPRSLPQQFVSNISATQSSSAVSSRTNLISVPIQEVQQSSASTKINMQLSPIQQSTNATLHPLHMPDNLVAAGYYSNAMQYVNNPGGTYSAPTVHTVMTQNYNTIPSITPQPNAVIPGVVPTQSVIHNMQLVSQAAHLNSRPSTVPPPPTPPQAPAASLLWPTAYGQQYGQIPHFAYDQSGYPGNPQNPQWNQQFF